MLKISLIPSIFFLVIILINQNVTAMCLFTRRLGVNSSTDGIQCVRECANMTGCQMASSYRGCTFFDSKDVSLWNGYGTLFRLNSVCHLSFRSPSNIPRTAPVQLDEFDRIDPNKTLCEVVTAGHYPHFDYNRWAGNRLDCLRECKYDSRCMGAVYRPGRCIKASRIVLSDRLQPYPMVGYVKKGILVPYFNNYCSLYDTIETCNSDDRCRWNQGRLGYNQLRIVFLGYCGRVRC